MSRLRPVGDSPGDPVQAMQHASGGDVRLADNGPGWYEWFVPGRLVNPLNRRWHWAVRMRWARAWRGRTAMICRPDSEWGATIPSRLSFMAHLHTKFDFDGLVASLKPVVDGLAPLVIHSDGPMSGHTFQYDQKICRKCFGVEIRVDHDKG